MAGMSRRSLLIQAGAAALGLAFQSGCSRRDDPDELVFRSWASEPDLVRINLERISKFAPDLKVDYAPISGAYHDKMVAQFVAKTKLDLVYVRDDSFAEWVEAGWLRPIDDLPGVQQYPPQMFPANVEAMTHNGRLYGLPFYTDFAIWIWNRKLLEAAGFQDCGRTLDQVAEQCIKIREKRIAGPSGVVEYPLVLGFKQALIGFADFWALMYASEVDLFTPALEPIFPDDPGHKCERILQWLVDAAHKHQILDLSASFTTTLVRDLFASGRVAMTSIYKYDLQRMNDSKKSQVAGDAVMALYPSLEPGQNGTLVWTRMYCIPTACRQVEKSWRLMNLVGGKTPDGAFSTAKFWYLQRGLGFAYPSLLNDPDIIASTSKWGEIEKIREQGKYARPREIIKAPWFPEFDTFYQAEIQEILQARITPRDGLARIAAECERLRRLWA